MDPHPFNRMLTSPQNERFCPAREAAQDREAMVKMPSAMATPTSKKDMQAWLFLFSRDISLNRVLIIVLQLPYLAFAPCSYNAASKFHLDFVLFAVQIIWTGSKWTMKSEEALQWDDKQVNHDLNIISRIFSLIFSATIEVISTFLVKVLLLDNFFFVLYEYREV